MKVTDRMRHAAFPRRAIRGEWAITLLMVAVGLAGCQLPGRQAERTIPVSLHADSSTGLEIVRADSTLTEGVLHVSGLVKKSLGFRVPKTARLTARVLDKDGQSLTEFSIPVPVQELADRVSQTPKVRFTGRLDSPPANAARLELQPGKPD